MTERKAPGAVELAAYYDAYDEDSRLTKDCAHGVEFTTTLHVLDRYLTAGAQTMLDVAAGTGRYAFYYAGKGCHVTALDLVPKHVDAITQKAARMAASPAQVLLGDAHDLSRWYTRPFDVVLNMGPLYHLPTPELRLECLRESTRVLSPDGILAYAYLNSEVLPKHPKGGPLFYGMRPEDALALPLKLGLQVLEHVAADGTAADIGPFLNGLSPEHFRLWLDFHLATCHTNAAVHATLHALVVCRRTPDKNVG